MNDQALNSNFSLFMAEIKKYPVLTQEQENTLITKYKETGDTKYRNLLIKHNLRYVIKLASEYKSNTPINELVNIGSIGFCVAIDKFDMTRNTRLITSATQWIKAYISAYFRDNANTIRLPANKYIKLQKSLRKSARDNRPITEFESDVNELYNLSFGSTSMSSPLGGENDDSSSYGDTLACNNPTPYQYTELKSANKAIATAFSTLPEKTKAIMTSLFGFDGTPKTLHEAGKEHGLSYERIRQIRDKAITKLRSDFPELKESLTLF